jgi:hypothetical protein
MPLEQRNCRKCGAVFSFTARPSLVRRGEGKFCSPSCSTSFNRTNKRSNNWRGGKKVVESGHVLVYVPDDPHARPDGYALEHRVLVSRRIGRVLYPSEVVHHKDGDPSNNNLDNLELLPSQSEHMKLHNADNKA